MDFFLHYVSIPKDALLANEHNCPCFNNFINTNCNPTIKKNYKAIKLEQ